jgi:hypothetical protein
MKTAHNKTDAVRWSVIQIGPTKKTIGHYADEARAEVDRVKKANAALVVETGKLRAEKASA